MYSKKGYLTRIIDTELETYLDTFGAVLLRGPKWCGKTTTAEIHAKSAIKMQDTAKSNEYIMLANTDISLILSGDNPRLIDEWQTAPQIWDAIRSHIDNERRTGLYILTGSRVPEHGTIMHSGAGRIGVLDMYPMTLYETGESNGKISLKKLFDGENVGSCESELSVKSLANRICCGGWPENLNNDYKKCALRLRSYLELIYESDETTPKKYSKNVFLAKEIVKSYSRNISQPSSLSTIYKDVVKNEVALSENKFSDCVNALKNTFVIDDVDAWNPAVRSKTMMRSTPKRQVVDPSIAALYLGITPDNFIENMNTFGYLFESLCIRDLRVYSSPLGGEIRYYRDKTGLETDAVILLDDGRYGLVEMKLGMNEIDDAAKNLNKLESLLVKNGFRSPTFKLILTGGKIGYQREDRVIVAPIGCLKD